MNTLFEPFRLGNVELSNRFVFPPIKLAYGNPDGTVTNRQLIFYAQIAQNGPGILILEPVSVTPEGKEHPRQLCIHLEQSEEELRKIVNVIHEKGRLACLHLNHAGAAANPMATKTKPKAPSPITCPSSGQESQALTEQEIEAILRGYKVAAEKAVRTGFDFIEIQAGHGYLVSQFLNPKINQREDRYGEERLLFARQVFSVVKESAGKIPCIVRVSGNEMSPESGLNQEDMISLLKLAEELDMSAIHVGMGNACFSPPWYFHHGSLPEKPQLDALHSVREHTKLPLIAAGRMGRREKIQQVVNQNLADIVALGRPLVADPALLEKWQKGKDDQATYCGYCLQGCLHRVKSGEALGCNVNPEAGQPGLETTDHPLRVLVAGGGPSGMSAASYLSRRGHEVTLAEKEDRLGGQFLLAWKAPGKEKMKETFYSLEQSVRASGAKIITRKQVNKEVVQEMKPDLLVWATGAVQNIPEISGLQDQYTLTSLQYFSGKKEVKGPRVLVIGAGRVGLEIAEDLGRQGYEVVATKRTDPIGSFMEAITRNLTLKRIGQMSKVTLMPHTTVKVFTEKSVDVEQDGKRMSLEPFNTIILCSGMLSAPGPDAEIRRQVPHIEVIGDAREVLDIYSATQAGYEVARKY